jgi:aminopeptidase N
LNEIPVYFTIFIISAQQTRFVDFKSVSGQLTLDAKEKSVAGSVHYLVEVLTTDTIKLTRKTRVSAVKSE